MTEREPIPFEEGGGFELTHGKAMKYSEGRFMEENGNEQDAHIGEFQNGDAGPAITPDAESTTPTQMRPSFDPEKYQNSPLQDKAGNLSKAITGGRVNTRLISRILEEVQEDVKNGFVTPEQGKSFMEDINRFVEANRQASGQRTLDVGGEAETEKKNHFVDFDIDKFKGTNVEQDAVRIRSAAMAGASPEEIKKIMQDIGESWLDENGSAKPEYPYDLTQKFRDEYSVREKQDEVQKSLETFEQARSRESQTPKSIQQVAMQIILAEGEDRWGKQGRFPLLDKENRIRKDNFVKWARERMLYQHLNNSRDPQLNLPAAIGVDNIYGSTISVFSMDKNRNQYFRDQLTGEVLEDLADQLKTEIWLFGSMRNYDLVYKQYMGSDEELPKFMANVHSKEELTTGDSMERLFKMSDNYGSKDTKVGDAFRNAYLMYYYISDVVKLREIIGQDSKFFKREGMEDAFRIIGGLKKDESIKPEHEKIISGLFNPDGSLNEARFIHVVNPFNEQNKNDLQIKFGREMVRRAIADKYGLEYGIDKSMVAQRNRSGALQAPERQFERMNLEYAETWAWIISRFTGAAARNDLEGIGFDAQTKYIKFLRSRRRQTAKSRAGAYGNKYNMGIHKQLTEDFFNGIFIQEMPQDKTISEIEKKHNVDKGARRTPFDIMVELNLIENEMNKILAGRSITDEGLSEEEKMRLTELDSAKKRLSSVRFDQSTQIGYTANHLGRATSIFHSLMGGEEMHLNEMVKWQQIGPLTGKWVIDENKFEGEFKEKLIKAYRYAYSTYGMIDFGEMVRTEDLTENGNRDRLPKWKNIVRADAYFGPIVTGDLKKEAYKILPSKLRAEVKSKKERGEDLSLAEKMWLDGDFQSDKSKEEMWRYYVRGEGRNQLWKRALMARISKDLFAHRIKTKKSKYAYMGFDEIEKFYEALESIQEELIVGDGEHNLDFKEGEHFFSKKELNWMRSHSATEKGRMIVQDLGPEILGGGLKGIGAGIKDIGSYILKAA